MANFDPSVVLPGALEAFMARGVPYGLPVGVTPMGISCNPRAFTAAGVTLPSPGWTLDDFEATCAALAAAIQAGRVQGVIAPLPPLVGHSEWTVGQARYLWDGEMLRTGVWGGFVLGYGGTIVTADGRFDLTNQGAVQGLTRLVEIARAYGAPQRYVPRNIRAGQTLDAAAAMRFQPFQQSGLTATLHWVPFPKPPARAVLPATLTGVAPAMVFSCGGYLEQLQPSAVPVEALEATALYARWVYALAAAHPSLPGMPPPVIADDRAQNAYWTLNSAGASGPAVDWGSYAFVEAGWPLTGPAGSLAGPGDSEAQWLVFQALTEAVVQGSPLPALLAATTRRLNAAASSAAAKR